MFSIKILRMVHSIDRIIGSGLKRLKGFCSLRPSPFPDTSPTMSTGRSSSHFSTTCLRALLASGPRRSSLSTSSRALLPSVVAVLPKIENISRVIFAWPPSSSTDACTKLVTDSSSLNSMGSSAGMAHTLETPRRATVMSEKIFMVVRLGLYVSVPNEKTIHGNDSLSNRF